MQLGEIGEMQSGRSWILGDQNDKEMSSVWDLQEEAEKCHDPQEALNSTGQTELSQIEDGEENPGK